MPWERAADALLGQACGDAFGAPFEFQPAAPELAKRSLELGRYLDPIDDVGASVDRWRSPGLYTDDTQQAVCLLRARAHTSSPEDAADHFRADCAALANQEVDDAFGAHRGTGKNFRRAITMGVPSATAGLGAAMRIGPVARTFDDPQALVAFTLAVSRVTTSDPVGLASALRFALAVFAEGRDSVAPVVPPLPEVAWRLTGEALQVAPDGAHALVAWGEATEVARGSLAGPASGFGPTGVAWVLACVDAALDYPDALRRVCAYGGDTDTVAAMAGALAAVRFGTPSIPEWMREQLVLDPTAEDWRFEHEGLATRQEAEHRARRRAAEMG